MSSEGEDSDVESTAPVYDQHKTIVGLTDFYHFLSTLPYIEPSAVLTPPPTGWPNITRENLSELGKNDEVINLLKHLPYIDLSRHQYVIAPETQPTDYRGEAFQRDVTKESIGRCIPLGDVEFPRWVVNLTHGNRDGTYAMLDTTDGRNKFWAISRLNDGMTDRKHRNCDRVQYPGRRRGSVRGR
jgi:hypothetical protein